LVLWDRCPGKTLPSWQVVQDVQGFVLLGWVLDERACLFKLDLVSMAHSINFD
jgi:hypothetical protein